MICYNKYTKHLGADISKWQQVTKRILLSVWCRIIVSRQWCCLDVRSQHKIEGIVCVINIISGALPCRLVIFGYFRVMITARKREYH